MAKRETKKNHFVSQAYMIPWCNNKKQIAFYRKIEKCYGIANTTNLCSENYLYTGKEGDNVVRWEEFYTLNVDNEFPDITKTTIELCSNPVVLKPLLLDNLKPRFSKIITIQLLRTPERIFSQRQKYNDLLLETMEKVRNMFENITQETLRDTYTKLNNDDEYKGIVLRAINGDENRLINNMMRIIYHKTWIIFRNNTSVDFITSDNPVVLYNLVDGIVGMRNGIAQEGVLIGYPISPRYLLLICPNNFLLEKFKKLYDNSCIDVYEDKVIDTWNKKQYKSAIKTVLGKSIKGLKIYCKE